MSLYPQISVALTHHQRSFLLQQMETVMEINSWSIPTHKTKEENMEEWTKQFLSKELGYLWYRQYLLDITGKLHQLNLNNNVFLKKSRIMTQLFHMQICTGESSLGLSPKWRLTGVQRLLRWRIKFLHGWSPAQYIQIHMVLSGHMYILVSQKWLNILYIQAYVCIHNYICITIIIKHTCKYLNLIKSKYAHV